MPNLRNEPFRSDVVELIGALKRRVERLFTTNDFIEMVEK